VATTRTYGDACGIPRALDRVGERWALMIVRELVLGPKRFTDLRAGLPHASPNVLSERLRELEAAGVVRRHKLPPPAASRVYELTEWGAELEHVLDALGRWGARAPSAPETCGMSPDAHILSLRTLFDRELAGDEETRLDIHLGDERFFAVVEDGMLTLEHGDAIEPQATVSTDHATLLALAHRRVELKEAIAAGEVEITGDRKVVQRFVRLFTLPEPAVVT
jgi:DNA-binding HxlR family transcriptional regulator